MIYHRAWSHIHGLYAFAICLATCLCLVEPRHSLGQDGGKAVDKRVAFKNLSPSEQQASLNAFETYVENSMRQWPVPGLSIAIVHDGKTIFSKGFGVKTAGTSDRVDGDTLFAIASNSKAFTAAALAILVDEKKLNWNDRVQDHLPWFQVYDPYVSREMRVSDLLCHRSGLGTFSGDLIWYGTSFSPKEIVERCQFLPQAGSFRDHYGYSNVMFVAAGLIVEKVSGKPWEEFVESRILQPIQMDRTISSVKFLLDRGNLASPHKNTQSGIEPIAWVNWDSMVAAGGIISSSNDMARWMLLQLGTGEIANQRIFTQESSERMWSPHTIIPISSAAKKRNPSIHFRAYGLGWGMADYQGHKIVSHGGGYDGMYSHQILIPDEQFGVIVLTNSMTSLPDSLAYRAIDMALGSADRDWSVENLDRYQESRKTFYKNIDQAIAVTTPDTQPSHPTESYTGNFTCPIMGDATIKVEAEKLVFRILSNPDLIADLEHLQYDTYRIRWRNKFAWFEDGNMLFVPDAHGTFQELKLDVPNEDLWFHELQFRRTSESE